MKYILCFSFFLSVFIFACTKDKADLVKAPEPVPLAYCDSMKNAGKVSYKCFVDSVMQARCISCHKSGGSAAAYDLTAYSGVKNNASAIKDIIQSTTTNPNGQMPQGGPFLSTDTINKIVSWVNDGAKNN